MDRNLVGTYAAKGAIQPMTDCIAQQKIDMSQYRPAAMTPDHAGQGRLRHP